MRHLIVIIITNFLIINCTNTKYDGLVIETYSDFHKEYLDSICKYNCFNAPLPKKYLIYVANNECSECIEQFVIFNERIKQLNMNDECYYIVTGQDRLIFDFYIKDLDIRFSPKAHILYDSLYFTEMMMPTLQPNQIIHVCNSSVEYVTQLNTEDKRAWKQLENALMER